MKRQGKASHYFNVIIIVDDLQTRVCVSSSVLHWLHGIA